MWIPKGSARKNYQGVRNVTFSENFANILNEWSLILLKLAVLTFKVI